MYCLSAFLGSTAGIFIGMVIGFLILYRKEIWKKISLYF